MIDGKYQTEIDKILSEIYYTPSHPGSYSSARRLHNIAKKRIINLKLSEVKDWLSGQIVYTLHKQSRRKFKRNPIIAERIKENFQADIVDVQGIAKYNDGFTFILTIIDVFTKKAWAIPLKSKSAATVVKAIAEVLENESPQKLQTDNGKEFVNSLFKRLMTEKGINHFTTKNKEIKCSIVERFNRTLRDKLSKYATKIGSRRYIDVLQNIIDSYNNTVHSTTKFAPNGITEENEKQIFNNIYGVTSKRELLRKTRKPKFKIGDSVRIKYELKILDRGYYPNWTDQIFTIYKSINKPNKTVYKIKNFEGEKLDKCFYQDELQIVQRNNVYRIEKILKEKYHQGKKLFYIKWLNHPQSENSWIESGDIFDV